MADPSGLDPALQRPGLPPRRRATVTRVVRVSPSMVSVTFAGEELAGVAVEAPASHIKLIFPAPGQLEPVPPTPDTPRALWPILRTYTPRRFDRAARELDVEMVIHGEGFASRWAETAAPGMRVIVAGPRGAYATGDAAAWQIVAADASGLPAACTIIEALGSGLPVTAIFEVESAAHERSDLPTEGGASVRWVHRGPDPRAAGSALVTALAALPLPPGPGRIWVACEAGAVRRVRAELLDRGFPAERLVTRGYWKLGESDHPDHDDGVDTVEVPR